MRIVEIKQSMECDVYTGHYFRDEVVRQSANCLDGFKWIAERENQFSNNASIMWKKYGDPHAFISGFGGDIFVYRLVEPEEYTVSFLDGDSFRTEKVMTYSKSDAICIIADRYGIFYLDVEAWLS